jgi:hypothetical protein
MRTQRGLDGLVPQHAGDLAGLERASCVTLSSRAGIPVTILLLGVLVTRTASRGRTMTPALSFEPLRRIRDYLVR